MLREAYVLSHLAKDAGIAKKSTEGRGVVLGVHKTLSWSSTDTETTVTVKQSLTVAQARAIQTQTHRRGHVNERQLIMS